MYPPNGQPPQGQQQPKWWQSLGQLGGSIGKIAATQMAQHRANKALQQDQPLQDAVSGIVDGATPPSAGAPPPVGPPPGGDGGGSDDYGEPMADGKVVTKPTLALIGEHQPEAVVPLTHRPGARVRPGMAMPPQMPGRRYYGE